MLTAMEHSAVDDGGNKAIRVKGLEGTYCCVVATVYFQTQMD
jgi:hypothetical protein